MIINSIHMKNNESIKLKVTQVTGMECLSISIGEKLSESYTTQNTTVSFFLTLGGLMDLYYQLEEEIEKLGIDA
jgi:hypothetical protein